MTMKTATVAWLFLLLALSAAVSTARGPSVSPFALGRIDAHAHVFNLAPEFLAMLNRLNLRVVNICVVDKHDRGYEEAAPQHQKALEIFRGSRGRAAWCSTFDPED